MRSEGILIIPIFVWAHASNIILQKGEMLDGPALRAFERIGELFSGDCASEIENGLQSDRLWAKTQATKIIAVSPFSTLTALRQIGTVKYLDLINEASKTEFRITSRLLVTRDFEEGVRANLIDREF